MSTLKVTYLQQASSASPNITLDASTNATVAGTLAMGHSFKRNRIINGDMRIDQRNAGASVTVTAATTYSTDRWVANASVASKYAFQQSSTAPSGFTNSIKLTSSSAYSVGSTEFFGLNQRIEGFNIADLDWGATAAAAGKTAKTVALSFWVYSSLSGTFGGALYSYSGDASYAFSYTISSTNTWEFKTITIAGATIGTFPTDNSGSLVVNFSIGSGTSISGTAGSWSSTLYRSATGATSVVGTNGATFYITGVQLETGSIATPYERQIYSDQLAQCQRYLPAFAIGSNSYIPIFSGANTTTSNTYVGAQLPVEARTAPTGYSLNAGNIYFSTASGAIATGTVVFWLATTRFIGLQISGGSGLVAGNGQLMQASSTATTIYATGCEL